jgi:predicted O-methyltransferase YrrM
MSVETLSKDVDRLLEALFIGADPELQSADERSGKAGLPAIAVSPMLGRFLNILAAAIGAKRILEIGALGGYSTIWLARALPPQGLLTTLELDQTCAKVTRQNLELAGLADRTEVIVGPALESLDAMITEDAPPFDFFFIDADKENYPAYLDRCLALAGTGSLIVADNVVRGGDILNKASSDQRVRGTRTFLQQASANPRLATSVVQTVGAKGYDGFSISRVM